MTNVALHCGDCLEVMKTLEANSVHSIVCDPPYMLNFMGKAFDRAKDNPAASVEVWAEALRVAKPGAHLLAFGGDRTHHRMMTAIEDAGWEIRTCLYWIFGSGFPKSHDISKALDRMAGAEREVIGKSPHSANRDSNLGYGANLPPEGERFLTAPATDAARQWRGWGTSLKPAAEIITVAQKPNLSLTQEQLFVIMCIVNFQYLLEITLCQVKVQLFANNAESHLRHLAQKSKEVGGNSALGRVWDCPNESELLPFVASVGQHLSDMLVGLEKMNLNIVPEDVRESISERLRANSTLTGAVESLCALMDMLLCEMETRTDLSMISSWRSVLVAALNLTSRFTTSTAFEAITVLRTLNWSLFQNISESIIPPKSSPINGCPSPVEIVASYLNDARQSMSAILTPIAAANVSGESNLRPAAEIIVMAMKPLDGTFANNALVHGVGGINVDACRIGTERPPTNTDPFKFKRWKEQDGNGRAPSNVADTNTAQGRWPANLLLDDEAARLLDEMSGERPSGSGNKSPRKHDDNSIYGKGLGYSPNPSIGGDSGGASRFFLRVAHDEDDVPLRFFYVPKASKRDRDEGLEGMELQPMHLSGGRAINTSKGDGTGIRENRPRANHHPTVKPTALMRYLCRLVTPPNGTILDPFLGSGSTLKAAKLEGFNGVGIEIDPEYLEIARRRIAAAQPEVKAQLPLLELAAAEEAHQ